MITGSSFATSTIIGRSILPGSLGQIVGGAGTLAEAVSHPAGPSDSVTLSERRRDQAAGREVLSEVCGDAGRYLGRVMGKAKGREIFPILTPTIGGWVGASRGKAMGERLGKAIGSTVIGRKVGGFVNDLA